MPVLRATFRTSAALHVDRDQAVALLLNTAYHLLKHDTTPFSDKLEALCQEADVRECVSRLAWEEETEDCPQEWHDSASNAQLQQLLNRARLVGDLGASLQQDRAVAQAVPAQAAE